VTVIDYFEIESKPAHIYIMYQLQRFLTIQSVQCLQNNSLSGNYDHGACI